LYAKLFGTAGHVSKLMAEENFETLISRRLLKQILARFQARTRTLPGISRAGPIAEVKRRLDNLIPVEDERPPEPPPN
jgi:hypothetical protein